MSPSEEILHEVEHTWAESGVVTAAEHVRRWGSVCPFARAAQVTLPRPRNRRAEAA